LLLFSGYAKHSLQKLISANLCNCWLTTVRGRKELLLWFIIRKCSVVTSIRKIKAHVLPGPQPAWDTRGDETFSERSPNFLNYVQHISSVVRAKNLPGRPLLPSCGPAYYL